MSQNVVLEKSPRQRSRSRSPRLPSMAVLPPSDWRDIFAEDSQIPFDNTQDALEAMRGELERTGPPEDTQPQLFEGQGAPEEGAQLPDNKPEVREKELQAVSSSDGEEKRECKKIVPEDETDDEDAKHQELVPEDNKCQEEKPEAYVVHSSPDSGTTEPAPDAEAQCKSYYERAHSQWVLEGRSSLP